MYICYNSRFHLSMLPFAKIYLLNEIAVLPGLDYAEIAPTRLVEKVRSINRLIIRFSVTKSDVVSVHMVNPREVVMCPYKVYFLLRKVIVFMNFQFSLLDLHFLSHC